MLETLMNPGSMTQDQWMIVGILVLIVIGIFYFLYRTWVVIRDSATKKYKPNIGLSRMQEQGYSVPKPAQPDASSAADEQKSDS